MAVENPWFFTIAEMAALLPWFTGLGVIVMSLYETLRFGSVEPVTVRGMEALLLVFDTSVNKLKGSTTTVTGRLSPAVFVCHVTWFVTAPPAGMFTVEVAMSKAPWGLSI